MVPPKFAFFVSAVIILAAWLARAMASSVPGTVFNLNGTDTGLTNIVAISSGFDSEMVLRSDGTVQTFNNSLIVNNQPADLNNVIAISAGGNFALALRSDGTVVGWGGRPITGGGVPPGLNGVVAISAGYDDAIALKNDGTVITWGFNYQGTNTPPAGLNGVIAIAAGLGFNLALKSDGTVVGWGQHSIIGEAVPAGLTNVVGISASLFRGQFAAVRSDGTVVGWGDNYLGAPTIPGISDAVAVAVQNGGGVVLRSNGTLTGWTVSLFGVIKSVSYPAVLNNITAISTRLALKAGPGLTTGGKALNVSTRLRVETGNNVLIGGFIVTGNTTKSIAIRGVGPSLTGSGILGSLTDPTLELRAANGTVLSQNDNWQDDFAQAAQLSAAGLPLQDSHESGIVTTLQPGAYTAILAGKNNSTGVGLVELYDLNQAADSRLANISTRGFIEGGNNVMIGGFILGGSPTTNTGVVVRGIGPSLAQFGLNPVLVDPTLELHNSNGATLVFNDNWQDDPSSAAQLVARGLAPQAANESGVFQSLLPGAFTAILAGQNGGIGIGLVEIYNVQ